MAGDVPEVTFVGTATTVLRIGGFTLLSGGTRSAGIRPPAH
ncbi:hypothetical protein [Micromonospora sp. R77]|nr:hypothetical protein [Micromonospora sp. R77]